jgi:phosphate transport system permease protein
MSSTRHLARRKRLSAVFAALCALATASCVALLLGLLGAILYMGLGSLNWNFFTHIESRKPELAGIAAGLVGSLWLIALTGVIAVPVGVAAAVYLEEYAPNTRWRRWVQLNIANLAGVPSIIYGILGLALFVRWLALGKSVWAGALTMSLVVLPIVILAAQEALRSVPGTLRQASYALGATRWQTVWHQVLPAALPGIMTGVILAISRALGEAAPLVAVGAALFVQVPRTPGEEFTALPLLVYSWSDRPQPEYHALAAAAIVVLLAVLILMNAGAVYVRYRSGKKIKW